MWMSEAPRLSESTSSTFVSLMTGAASADLARLPRSISSSSALTVSTSASASLHRVEVDLGQAADRGHVVDAEGRPVEDLLEALPPPAPPSPAAAAGAAAAVAPQLERARRAVVAVDRVLEGALRGHDRLDVVAGHELDVVHGEHVRRVRHGDRERRAGARERQDLVLPRRLGRDDLDDRGVDLEVVEVDRGHAVLPREQARDLLVLDEARGSTKALPSLPPFVFWWFSASWSCCGDTMFSFSSSSPSLTGIQRSARKSRVPNAI